MENDGVAIASGARTLVGSFGGASRETPVHDLGALTLAAAIEHAGVSADDIGEVVMGCIGQVGLDAYNARRVALAAGKSVRRPALTVNPFCGAGLQASWSRTQELLWVRVDVVLTDGESTSRAPFCDYHGRFNDWLGDRALIDGTVGMVTDTFSNKHLGVTSENVASCYGAPRVEQEEFAVEGQRPAPSDAATTVFAEERADHDRRSKAGRDRHQRVSTTRNHPRDTCRAASGAHPNGSATGGNTSRFNDGAVVLIREHDSFARSLRDWTGSRQLRLLGPSRSSLVTHMCKRWRACSSMLGSRLPTSMSSSSTRLPGRRRSPLSATPASTTKRRALCRHNRAHAPRRLPRRDPESACGAHSVPSGHSSSCLPRTRILLRTMRTTAEVGLYSLAVVCVPPSRSTTSSCPHICL